MTSNFYKTIYLDDYKSEVVKRLDNIKQKSTGFYIFKAIRRIYPNNEIGLPIDVGGNMEFS